MKDKRTIWLKEGRPRSTSNVAYINYKDAKPIFRRVHRQCVVIIYWSWTMKLIKLQKLTQSILEIG